MKTVKAPVGAISEKRRHYLRTDAGSQQRKKMKFYRVLVQTGVLSTRIGDIFLLVHAPETGYCFTNYFHALAYSLQLQAKKQANNE